MGFGTLFIGYFLLLNVTYFPASDVFAGLVMALGLICLAPLNREFSLARSLAIGFAAFGGIEFILFFLGMFSPEVDAVYSEIYGFLAVLRYLVLAVLSYATLRGMYSVSREVGLDRIPERCRLLAPVSVGIYALWMLLELPVGEWMPTGVQAGLYLCAIVAILALHLTVLVTIYGCYMQICMPGEENGRKKKPSRFGFVNEYRERQEQKEKEAEDYRREVFEKRKKKGRKK